MIGVITILLILGFVIFIIFINNDFKYNETYYLLKVNDNNRIIKKNNNEYCEPMNKIEYVYSFPHVKSLIIYCDDNTLINLYESNEKLIDKKESVRIYKIYSYFVYVFVSSNV